MQPQAENVKAEDLAGESWLLANDPTWKRSRDFDHKFRAFGLTAQLEAAAARKGCKLVEHGAQPTAKTCMRCLRAFNPIKSDHDFCGAICRQAARRDYMRDYMRRRRAA